MTFFRIKKVLFVITQKILKLVQFMHCNTVRFSCPVRVLAVTYYFLIFQATSEAERATSPSNRYQTIDNHNNGYKRFLAPIFGRYAEASVILKTSRKVHPLGWHTAISKSNLSNKYPP